MGEGRIKNCNNGFIEFWHLRSLVVILCFFYFSRVSAEEKITFETGGLPPSFNDVTHLTDYLEILLNITEEPDFMRLSRFLSAG